MHWNAYAFAATSVAAGSGLPIATRSGTGTRVYPASRLIARWSDQYDAEIQMSGFATEWDQTVIRGNIEERSFVAFLLEEEQLLSAFSMNWKLDVRRSMPLIKARAHPDPRAQPFPGRAR